MVPNNSRGDKSANATVKSCRKNQNSEHFKSFRFLTNFREKFPIFMH